MKLSNYRKQDLKKMLLVFAIIGLVIAVAVIVGVKTGFQMLKPKVDAVIAESKEKQKEREQEKAEEEEWNRTMNAPMSSLKYKGHYYYVFDNASSWEDAKERCEVLGGHLATMTTKGEDEAVYEYVASTGHDTVFFGMYMDWDQDRWRWVVTEGTVYTNWTEGEPDTGSGDCLYATYCAGDQSKWRALDAERTSAYICEWESLDQARKPEFREDTRFDTVEPVLKHKTHYYMILEGEQTWDEAKARCESLGGHLAVINGKKENKKLANFMRKRGYDFANFGYSDRDSEGNWKWVDGYKSKYKNWDKLQPDNYEEGEDYAMFYDASKYKWNDGQWIGVYFCEWDE